MSGFNFYITYRPGVKAVRPDALSKKAEDRLSASNPEDNRIKNRKQVLLPKERFDDNTFTMLLEEANRAGDVSALPIDLILLEVDKPIDDLINAAYTTSDLVAIIRDTLRNPRTRKWLKSIRKQLRIALENCKLINDRVYYKNRLFIPPNDKLRT